ncbi:MAG: FtsW/RodA/SpoVE family cell cycle protein [Oscillospiraceae bacterium]
MENLIQGFKDFFTMPESSGFFGGLLSYLVYFSRFMLPIIAVAVISRCVRSMLSERYEPEVWGYLDLPDGSRVPLRHWECTIGKSRGCDIVVNSQRLASRQVVLIRNEQGKWTAFDIGGGNPSYVNDEEIPENGAALLDGDTLELSGCSLNFFNLTEDERSVVASRRTAPGRSYSPLAMFAYISLFQFLLMFQHFYYAKAELRAPIALAFIALFAIMWIYFLFLRAMGRRGFEVEAIAFFLSSIGMSVCASSAPAALVKQIILLIVGIAVFVALCWWLRDMKRVKASRVIAAGIAVGLLAINLVLGTEKFGAKNWISIGGFTVQPSEFVKILYIFAGAATLDRLYRGRNLLLYIVFSAVCVGALALMGDFGGALVFFATFLVISFMRSGSIGTIILAVSGAALAGFLALSIKPHIAQRFANWGHVWEDINGAGFQQTRALAASASGGFFGLGAGNGWLHSIVAADTDLVFGMVTEELGLIIGVCAIAAIIVLAAFTIKNAAQGRSSFYVIAGCAAVSMLMVQLGLNVFGSLDILPFTGVTFPFVSMGGSSLISCWALLAFVKATDTRKNASLAIKAPTKMHDVNEFTIQEEAPRPVQRPAPQPEDYFGVNERLDEFQEDDLRNLFDRRNENRGQNR